MTEAEFIYSALANKANADLLVRLRSIGLPDCYLAGGCLFQPIWNRKSGRAADWGIKDYDVFYFDKDISWEAEDRIIREVAKATGDLGVAVEIRNQARVHLWYPDRFGRKYPQLTSARDGIDRYLISCTCIGFEVESGQLYAPNSLQELACGVLRPNPLNWQPDLFIQKAQSYQSRWPWLTIAAGPPSA
jgi:hypothetical protein